MPNLFQTFINKVGRGYGQVDKRIFGGLLPGGAATPIGEAVQRAEPRLRPDPLTRRVASIADVATTAVAKAQPFVENAVRTSPAPVKNLLSSGLNSLPFSVNLFGRYYTGLGNQGLSVPQDIKSQVIPQLMALEKNRGKLLENSEKSVDFFQNLLNTSRNIGAPSGTVNQFNDQLASSKSNLERIKKGELPYSGYNTVDENPLSSSSTSLGSVWFKPEGKGYTANETYDFVYGGADKKESIGPFLQEVTGVPSISPSQEQLLRVVGGQKLVPGAVQAPLTNIGRAIISKIPNKKFDYTITIP